MRVKFCPKCKSNEIIMIAGGAIGIYECNKCKYRGSILPEREMKLKKKKSRKGNG